MSSSDDDMSMTDSSTLESDQDVSSSGMDDQDEQYEALAAAFKEGVEVKNRMYHLRTYKECFVGSEAVNWLCAYTGIPDRQRCVEIGQRLMDMGLFDHVVAEHQFKDEYLFFRFSPRYDLVVVGAGSAGMSAAKFAAKLGARVALVEQERIGGDCTWTGCIPSKALLKVAKVAHTAKTAAHYGVQVGGVDVKMKSVRGYVRNAIQEVYANETPDALREMGIKVFIGPTRFLDPECVECGDLKIRGKRFIIATGAYPHVPSIQGIDKIRYFTHKDIFENSTLPEKLVVIGGGPVGCELGQAYSRLGARVTIIAPRLLPKSSADASTVITNVFTDEGITVVNGHASTVQQSGDRYAITVGHKVVKADMVLLACGRRPNVHSLNLQAAGVVYSENGIAVDQNLRTRAKHIYACGDVTGGPQFTHYAAWQAYQAVRNALLPGSAKGHSQLIPRVTYTDPEVAQVGLVCEEAHEKHGAIVECSEWDMEFCERAVCENDTSGFLHVCHFKDRVLGATIVSSRAGESIAEYVTAMHKGNKLSDMGKIIHPYPTYSTMVQELSADLAVDHFIKGASGKLVRRLVRSKPK